MKNIHILLIALCVLITPYQSLANAGGIVSLQKTQREGREIIEVSNDLILAEIVPALGGRILKLEDRSLGYSYFYDEQTLGVPAPESGYFLYGGYEEMLGPERIEEIPGVRIAETRWGGSLCRSPYVYKIVKNTSEEAVIYLTGQQDYLHVARTVTIRAGDPTLYIQATITNTSDKEQYFGLWLHPCVHAGRESGTEDIFITEADGKLMKMDYTPGSGPTFFYPSGGYWAAIDRKIAGATVLRFTPGTVEWLKLFRVAGAQYHSMELCTKARVFSPGQSETHFLAYTMLQGMTDINYAHGLDFVQIDTEREGKTGKLLLAVRRWNLESANTLIARLTVRKKDIEIEKANVTLPANGPSGAVATIPLKGITNAEEDYEVMCSLFDLSGKQMGDFTTIIKAVPDQTNQINQIRKLKAQAEMNRTEISSLLAVKKVDGLDIQHVEMLSKVLEIMWENATYQGISTEEEVVEWQDVIARQEQLLDILR